MAEHLSNKNIYRGKPDKVTRITTVVMACLMNLAIIIFIYAFWNTATIQDEDPSYAARARLSVLAAILVFAGIIVVMWVKNRHGNHSLMRLAYEDELTGGPNNAAFQLCYEELQRSGKPTEYAIALIDVKDFKLINEVGGYRAGDLTIRYVYQMIQEEIDANQGEFAARAEMDHFFVCFHENERDAIQARLDRIRKNVNASPRIQDRGFTVEFRQGACIVRDETLSITELEDRARIAKSASSRGADNLCAFYTDAMHDKIFADHLLDHMAELSLENREFEVYYQPKVSMSTGKIKGAEALVRWNHPQQGLISPGQFIPVLEETGRIQAVDRYVFEEVCRWLSERESQGLPMFPVSINLSRMHFWKENFLQDYIDIADKHHTNRAYIEFEITETVFMEESKLAKIKDGIAQMHAAGFRCAVDDFGVGYSSLSLVHDMDVDVLKFDRSFFVSLEEEKSQKVVRCLINMANELQMGIVIEGIETQAQIDFLKDEACDVIQGFYFSKPLAEHDFDEWAAKHE